MLLTLSMCHVDTLYEKRYNILTSLWSLQILIKTSFDLFHFGINSFKIYILTIELSKLFHFSYFIALITNQWF